VANISDGEGGNPSVIPNISRVSTGAKPVREFVPPGDNIPIA